MANLFDYLDWRGDLTVSQDPFHTIDSLILSTLSYIEFEKLNIEFDENASIFFREAGEQFVTMHADEKLSAGRLIPDSIFDLLDVVSRCPRFRDMRISNYVNQIDELEEKQFSAMTVEIGDGTFYIAFRGTDDTIIGWKEDFNMSFKAPVPSQLQAVEYVKKTALLHRRGKIRMGGHSKGGNLAVYAAAFSPERIRKRILQVHNFDGPGFTKEILEQAGHKAIADVVQTIVPQSSVIGMLLEHEEQYDVVVSRQIGIFQHDMFSWQLFGRDFIYVDDISASSYRVDRTLRDFILAMDKEEKEKFVEAFFDILMQSGAKTLSELKLKDIVLILKKTNREDGDHKKILMQAFRLLLATAEDTAQQQRIADMEKRLEKKKKIPPKNSCNMEED